MVVNLFVNMIFYGRKFTFCCCVSFKVVNILIEWIDSIWSVLGCEGIALVESINNVGDSMWTLYPFFYKPIVCG
jgi:hypothetical protein